MLWKCESLDFDGKDITNCEINLIVERNLCTDSLGAESINEKTTEISFPCSLDLGFKSNVIPFTIPRSFRCRSSRHWMLIIPIILS
jgi:hypothetical protein